MIAQSIRARRSAAERIAVVLALGLWLGACAVPTPYQPRDGGYGYAEQQVDGRTWRVEFVGNSATPRQTVEDYLLYRAAEIMLFGGYDRFVVLDKEIEARTSYSGYPADFGWHGSVFHGSGFHRHHGVGFGVQTLDPVVRYAGFATVRTYDGEARSAETPVYDAQEVVNTIGPRVRLPDATG